MRVRATLPWVILMVMAAPVACAPQLRALPESDKPELEAARLDHGYALLYDLLRNEAKVSEILAIKSASEPTKVLLKDISNTATRSLGTIDEMKSVAPPVDLTAAGLPLIETDARHRIANVQTEELLLALGSFELKILLTQQQACQYAWALARSLAKVDPNVARARAMSKIAAEFHDLDKRVIERLSVAPVPQPTRDGNKGSGTG